MRKNMVRQFPEIEAALNELSERIEKLEKENIHMKELLEKFLEEGKRAEVLVE